MPSPQYTAWCFTLNNFSQDHIQTLLGVAEFKYVIFGEEKGDEKGTEHLQGYFELDKKKTFNGVKSLLISYDETLTKVHLERRIGSQIQAIDYCRKSIQSKAEWTKFGAEGPNFGKGTKGKIHEKGSKANQGNRVDLDKVRQDVIEGGMRSVTRWANFQQAKVAQLYLMYNEEKRFCPGEMEVTYIYGKTGLRKTARAYNMAKATEEDYFEWSPSIQEKWWDGYDGEKVLIIDDLSSNDIENLQPKYFLTLLGGYGMKVQTKGGMRECAVTKVFITSIRSPKQLWMKFSEVEPFKQFRRRITRIIHVKPKLKTTTSKGVAKSGSKKSRGNTKDLKVRPLEGPSAQASEEPPEEFYFDIEESDVEK